MISQVGTTIRIKLPLFREKENLLQRPFVERQVSVQHISVPPSVSLRTVAVLHPIRRGATGVHYGREDDLAVREEIKSSVLKTVLGWLHMKLFNAEEEVGNADYLLLLAEEISVIEPSLNLNASKAIALLQHDSQRRGAETLLAQKFDVFETISAPFGPRKLAGAVAACELAADRRQESPCDFDGPNKPETTCAHDREISLNAHQGQDQLQTLVNGHGPELDHSLGPKESQRGVNFITSGIDKDCESDMTSALGHSKYHRGMSDAPIGGESLPEQINLGVASSNHFARASNGRLLLVDDNHINLSLLATFVKRLKRPVGYECAENGLLALEAAKRNTSGFDIIFMDISMPGMDGLEATREIRKLERNRLVSLGEAAAPPPALIIALTGLANSRDQIEAFTSGVDLFMTKPTKFKEIGSLIEEWHEKGPHHIRARQNQIQND